jgi:predicted DNA-binding protein with PD1-like motif
VELSRGDKVIESIESALKEVGVKNAVVVSGIGSLQKLKYHRPLDLAETANDEYLCIEAPLEVGSLAGSVIDGVGHFHIVPADLKQVHSGHLELESEVLYLMEVILAELEGCNLERKLTPENVKKLFIKQ